MVDLDLDNEKITLEKDGKEITCDILFTFDSEDTGKAYVGYTDHSTGINGRKNIYVSSYDPLKNDVYLEDITDERELQMVNDVLNEIDNM